MRDKNGRGKGKEGGSEGERENESPAERREKNTESRRCRRDGSEPFSQCVFTAGMASLCSALWQKGGLSNVLGSKGLEGFLHGNTHILMSRTQQP